MTTANEKHWDDVYAAKAADEVSWFEARPAVSLDLIARHGRPDGSVIDVGGGASVLVDALVADGLRDVTVLDLSANALAAARARLGERATSPSWIVADVAGWQPDRTYDIWHDRAALHFLNTRDAQAAYAAALTAALAPGGVAIIGTFAPDGPEQCSNLPVTRHDAASLGAMLGGRFELIQTARHAHHTPWGSEQRFQFSVFRATA